MRVLVALLVWIIAVAGAVGISNVVADSIHNPPGSTAAGGSFDAGTVKATDSLSLFHTANFTKALATARSHLGPDATLDMVVIYPGYLDLTAVRGGSEVDVYVNAAGTYDETNTGGNPGDTPLFQLARVNDGDPAAISQRIAGSGQLPQSELHYMIAEVDSSTHHFHWLVYPVQGTAVEYFELAGPRGRLYEYRTGSSTGLQPVGS